MIRILIATLNQHLNKVGLTNSKSSLRWAFFMPEFYTHTRICEYVINSVKEMDVIHGNKS